tara:strand:- start:1005 stop:1874 length:870 start_codon:yes stop_codon:yes gene_type:complete
MKEKKLSDVVPDIYAVLDSLTEGNELDISEETYEQFGKEMSDALRHWATPQDRSSKETLRMSNIGKPERRLWFDAHTKSDSTEKLTPNTQIKFLYGHLLEVLVLFFVKLSGHNITSMQKEITVNGIKGHMDCKIDGQVVDVKTASGYAFKKFRDGTLGEDDPFGYLAQLAGYEEAEGTNEGGFLVMNKETGELCTYIPDDMEKPNIVSRIDNVKELIVKDTPPDFCYDDVAEGVSGNMKLSKGCGWCPHKIECHKDANDGQGLKAYSYAKGPVYFTKIVKQPKVEEIKI